MIEIPKTIFFYWEADRLSWLRYMTLYSFRVLNPEWKMQLYVGHNSCREKTWVDHNQSDFYQYTGLDWFDKIYKLDIEVKDWNVKYDLGSRITPPQASDLFQWERLNEGGVYSDMDVLYDKPIDSIYDLMWNYTTCLCYLNSYFTIGFLASSGKSRFWEELLDAALNLYRAKQVFGGIGGETCYQVAGVNALYSLYRDKRRTCVFKRGRAILDTHWHVFLVAYRKSKLFNIPKYSVYNWTHMELGKIFEESLEIPEETIGIHWYGGSEIAQQANLELTPDNLKDNTLCRVLKKFL